MNPVGELLGVEDIDLDLDATDRKTVLERIAALLARKRGLSESAVLAGLVAREQMGSTGLGQGIAIPHARMPQCAAEAGALIRTKFAVPFDAPDGKPVSIFLGLIVPQRATERHLQLLASAATMFGDRAFREKIKACPDASNLRELVAAWPDPGT